MHGDLKGVRTPFATPVASISLTALQTNILVNEMGRACLVDYGLSAVSGKLGLTAYSNGTSRAGSAPWQAPELFDPEGDVVRRTEASDVYSWACVAYEVNKLHVSFPPESISDVDHPFAVLDIHRRNPVCAPRSQRGHHQGTERRAPCAPARLEPELGRVGADGKYMGVDA